MDKGYFRRIEAKRRAVAQMRAAIAAEALRQAREAAQPYRRLAVAA